MKRRLLIRQLYLVLVFGTLADQIIEICGTLPHWILLPVILRFPLIDI